MLRVYDSQLNWFHLDALLSDLKYISFELGFRSWCNEGITPIARWPIYPNNVPQIVDREPRQEKVQLSRYRYVNSKVIRYLARPPSLSRSGLEKGRSNERWVSVRWARRILNGESPAPESDHAWKKNTRCLIAIFFAQQQDPRAGMGWKALSLREDTTFIIIYWKLNDLAIYDSWFISNLRAMMR